MDSKKLKIVIASSLFAGGMTVSSNAYASRDVTPLSWQVTDNSRQEESEERRRRNNTNTDTDSEQSRSLRKNPAREKKGSDAKCGSGQCGNKNEASATQKGSESKCGGGSCG